MTRKKSKPDEALEFTELDVLIAARALYDSPEKWTQKVFARDKDGNAVTWENERAVCFCLSGAIARAELNLGFTTGRVAYRAIVAFQQITGIHPISTFNDASDTDFDLVINTLDDVIAMVKKKQPQEPAVFSP